MYYFYTLHNTEIEFRHSYREKKSLLLPFSSFAFIEHCKFASPTSSILVDYIISLPSFFQKRIKGERKRRERERDERQIPFVQCIKNSYLVFRWSMHRQTSIHAYGTFLREGKRRKKKKATTTIVGTDNDEYLYIHIRSSNTHEFWRFNNGWTGVKRVSFSRVSFNYQQNVAIERRSTT